MNTRIIKWLGIKPLKKVEFTVELVNDNHINHVEIPKVKCTQVGTHTKDINQLYNQLQPCPKLYH